MDAIADELADLAGRAGEVGLRLVVATFVALLSLAAGRVLQPIVRWRLERRDRPSYRRVYLGLYRAVVIALSALVALTVAFPSVRVADVLAIFGILSVAAGFAFRDTFENLLAGVLLLRRDAFHSGDEVVVGDHEGTIEGVTVRETLLRTADGRRILLPNATVASAVIEVATDLPVRRSAIRLDLDDRADVAEARTAAVVALRGVPGVVDDPPPTAHLVGTGPGSVVLECRFWTGSRRREVVSAVDGAIEAVTIALRRSGIAAPVDQLQLVPGEPPGA